MAQDLYEILGVSRTASQKEIQRAYRKLARKWHPDLNPGNKESEKRFKEISRAYDVLGREEKRKLYDEFGEQGVQAGFDAEKARQYKQWDAFQQAGRARSAQEPGRFTSYEDIFGDIFEFRGGRAGFRTTMPTRAKDIEHDMTIDLISALKGFETQLSMEKMKECPACRGGGTDPHSTMTPCSACGGSGRLNVAEGPLQFTKPCPRCRGHGKTGKPCAQCGGTGHVLGTETIRVVIPKGVREGQKVRVAGKGEPGLNGGKSGDLYLIIHIKPHPFLRREGDDLHMEVPVTVREAMAGGTMRIPTIDGQVNVKVPPKSQSGKTLRLKGKGAINPRTKQRGDLMIKLVVRVPQTDDREILQAVEKMDRLYKEDVRGNIKL